MWYQWQSLGIHGNMKTNLKIKGKTKRKKKKRQYKWLSNFIEDRHEERDPHERDDSDPDEPTPKRIFKIDQDTHD